MSGITFLLLSCVVLSLSVRSSARRDLYAILGLKSDASERDISRAFRQLSRSLHPDKHSGNAAKKQEFLDIQEANSILSNPDLRTIYDFQGDEGIEYAKKVGLENLRRSPDARISVPISLEEVYNGAEKDFEVSRKVVCKSCRGTGGEGGNTRKCSTCKGRGVVQRLRQLGIGFTVRMEEACDVCGGTGYTYTHKCKHCHGSKVVSEAKSLNVHVEKGVEDGHEVVFERASEQVVGQLVGHIQAVLQIQKHPRFTRDGDNLHITLTISLRESLLGFKKTIKQLDGRDVIAQRSEVTPHGYKLVVAGEGMPRHEVPSLKGDMIVYIKVSYPLKLSEHQKQELLRVFPRELKDASSAKSSAAADLSKDEL